MPVERWMVRILRQIVYLTSDNLAFLWLKLLDSYMEILGHARFIEHDATLPFANTIAEYNHTTINTRITQDDIE
jgi:hypothetical protein